MNNLVTAIDGLNELWEECGEPNWNGEGAEPITEEMVNKTIVFLKQLPDSILPKCEFSCDPDGCVTVEWYADRHNLISISISKHGDSLICTISEDGETWTIIRKYHKMILDEINKVIWKGECLGQ